MVRGARNSAGAVGQGPQCTMYNMSGGSRCVHQTFVRASVWRQLVESIRRMREVG